jgi:hypothetical protein
MSTSENWDIDQASGRKWLKWAWLYNTVYVMSLSKLTLFSRTPKFRSPLNSKIRKTPM